MGVGCANEESYPDARLLRGASYAHVSVAGRRDRLLTLGGSETFMVGLDARLTGTEPRDSDPIGAAEACWPCVVRRRQNRCSGCRSAHDDP